MTVRALGRYVIHISALLSSTIRVPIVGSPHSPPILALISTTADDKLARPLPSICLIDTR